MPERPDHCSERDWEAMPDQVRRMVAAISTQAERAGVPMPEVDEMGIPRLPPPAISLKGRPSVITRKIAEIAAGAGLYQMNEDLVLIDGRTGEKRVMTAKIFREWIDNHCVVYKKKVGDAEEGARPVPDWMPKEMAESMLASPDFRSKIPKVSRVNVVRLPVFRRRPKDKANRAKRADRANKKDEHGQAQAATGGANPQEFEVWRPGEEDGFEYSVELLPEGYDAESMTYTVKGLDYDTEMDVNEGIEWIRGLLQYFDWAPTDRETEKGTLPLFGRSFSVFISAALTPFCETLFEPGITKPMFLFNANEVGSGKTLLAQVCLYPVIGFMGPVRWRDNEEEMIKTLDANARWMRPALFLDDLAGHIKSELLNQWSTEPMHEGRLIGTGEWFAVPRVGVTMMTGNGVSLERDINRRTLMVDLFMTCLAREKKYPEGAQHLTWRWFLKPEIRRRWLSVMWAIVREFWNAQRPKDYRPLETFEDWSDVVVPMVRALGLPDPLEPYTPPDAGDQSGDDVAKLMAAVIQEKCVKAGRETARVTLTDMVPIARRNALFVNVLGTVEDAYRGMSAGKGAHFRKVIWEEGDGTETRDPTEDEKREQSLGWLPADNKMATSFGSRFGKRATGKVVSVGGRRWQFGKRGESKRSEYEIKVVS